MRSARKERIASKSAVILSALIVLMAAIFVVDTVTDYALAAAVFHTTVILIATRFLSARTVIVLAGICVALTFVSFGLTRSGAYEVGLNNTAISVVAIGITAYLGLKLKSAELAAHEARERLLRIARMTTLGQLTTSIAHEVSQPLAAIATSTGACSRWLDQTPPNVEKARATVERIAADAGRAREVLGRVRSFARNEAPACTPFDLNLAVREMLDLSKSDIARTRAALVVSLDDSLPDVFADRIQIQQVICNLLLNAVEAISAHPGPHPRIVLATEEGEPGRVRFSISDSGPGLSADAARHLFDAFWTTKEGGFGLGLTISRAIVEANGGRIWTTPAAGGGTRFLFDVPVTGKAG